MSAYRSAAVLLGACSALMPAMATVSADPQATSQLQVTTTVVGKCTITTQDVTFGNYDPVVANATAPLDGAGGVTISCTQGTVATIGIDVGSNSQGSLRRMAGGTKFLSYELYKDSARAQVWGSAGAAAMVLPAAPSMQPRTYQIYGRLPPAQDVPSGAYIDRALATVSF